MTSLFNLEPVAAPHKTRRFWTLLGLVGVAVLLASLVQRAFGLSLHAQIVSGVATLAAGLTACWIGVRFGWIGWLIVAVLAIAFTVWAASYTSLHVTPRA